MYSQSRYINIVRRCCIILLFESRHEKTVFGICDQVRHKPACSATETSSILEISAIASWGIILSKQRKTKALIRLQGCAGWSAHLLFSYGINRFSHDVVHLLYWVLGSVNIISLILSRVNCKIGRKREIPEKHHLTSHKQNLACLTVDPS